MDGRQPEVRHVRQRADAGATILAALGVVGRGGDHSARPVACLRDRPIVQPVGTVPEGLRRTAHLVE